MLKKRKIIGKIKVSINAKIVGTYIYYDDASKARATQKAIQTIYLLMGSDINPWVYITETEIKEC